MKKILAWVLACMMVFSLAACGRNSDSNEQNTSQRESTKEATKEGKMITINEGDLMLYGSNTVVLFYKTFKTSYSYVKLGHISDTAGLAKALGSGSVRVTFSVL